MFSKIKKLTDKFTSSKKDTVVSDTNRSPSSKEVIKYFQGKCQDYSAVYNPTSLFEKIGKYAKQVGIQFIYKALLLYCGLQSDRVAKSDKLLAIAALGYFIAPFDLLPDIIPGGFFDDGTILAFALKRVYDSLDSYTKNEAKKLLHSIFGEVDETVLTI